MTFLALHNFRAHGILYNIGDPVPDELAARDDIAPFIKAVGNSTPSVDLTQAPVQIDGEGEMLGEKEVSVDDAITLMFGQVAALEGLTDVATSKVQILKALIGHYIAVGLIAEESFDDTASDLGGADGSMQIMAGDGIGAPVPLVDTLTVTQLREIAAVEGISIDAQARKADIIAAIVAKRAVVTEPNADVTQ